MELRICMAKMRKFSTPSSEGMKKLECRKQREALNWFVYNQRQVEGGEELNMSFFKLCPSPIVKQTALSR
jgi:hypothetical protein